MNRYGITQYGRLFPSKGGSLVFYSDIIELQKEVEHLREYTDHLVKFSKLPCLPKDLENLREVNTKFAIENEQLKNEIVGWKNKWECAIELAAQAEHKLQVVKDYINNVDEF